MMMPEWLAKACLLLIAVGFISAVIEIVLEVMGCRKRRRG